MNPFIEVLTQMIHHSDNIPDFSKIKMPSTDEEYLLMQCDFYNQNIGDLKDYECPDCLNKGYIAVPQQGDMVLRICKCMTIRKNNRRLRNSGLEKLAQQCTFDNFQTPEEWQKIAKYKAIKYVSDNSGKWLFFGGQSGCGKTHLCTAICTNLINQKHDVKYVLWRDIVHYLEQNRFNEEKYIDKIRELQNIEILYIDDFLKTTHRDKNGKTEPSENELNIAYEIINARVISASRTIISSELSINDISMLDEATGGRISSASKGHQILINKDKNRNFRFYGKGEENDKN